MHTAVMDTYIYSPEQAAHIEATHASAHFLKQQVRALPELTSNALYPQVFEDWIDAEDHFYRMFDLWEMEHAKWNGVQASPKFAPAEYQKKLADMTVYYWRVLQQYGFANTLGADTRDFYSRLDGDLAVSAFRETELSKAYGKFKKEAFTAYPAHHEQSFPIHAPETGYLSPPTAYTKLGRPRIYKDAQTRIAARKHSETKYKTRIDLDEIAVEKTYARQALGELASMLAGNPLLANKMVGKKMLGEFDAFVLGHIPFEQACKEFTDSAEKFIEHVDIALGQAMKAAAENSRDAVLEIKRRVRAEARALRQQAEYLKTQGATSDPA